VTGPRALRVRVLALLAGVLLSLTGALGFVWWQQQQVAAALTIVTDAWLPLAKVAAQLERDRQRVEADARRLGDEEDLTRTRPARRRLYTDELRVGLAEGRVHAEHGATLGRDEGERAAFERIGNRLALLDNLFRDYEASYTRMLDAVAADDRDAIPRDAAALTRDGARLGREIESLAIDLDSEIAAVTAQTGAAQARASGLAAALFALAVALSVLSVVAIQLALRPIARLTAEVQRLASGAAVGRVAVSGGDEIAVLASEFNAMAEAIGARDRTLSERAAELRRVSAYLANVLDSLEDALLVVENGKVTRANAAATAVWGARDGLPVPEALQGTLEAPDQQHDVTSADGRAHRVRLTALSGPGRDGFVLVSEDVTGRLAADRRLARSERLALVGQMLAQITHEVRNPLNALSLNVELLGEELTSLVPEQHEAREILALVTHEIERLTRVTGHYLALARRRPARLQPTDLPAVIHRVLRLLDPELSAAGARIEVDLEALPPQPLDGEQVQQALVNVVQNAVAVGARSVRVRLARQEAAIHLSVQDDGPGMTPEEVAQAGEPFFTTRASGTGLGLAITRQILEDHDGHLIVHSAPGAGTTIVLVIPFRDGDSTGRSATHRGVPAAPEPP
jgi:signal transduction histidine kinase